MRRALPIVLALAACGGEEVEATACTRGPAYGHALLPSGGEAGEAGAPGVRVLRSERFVPGTPPRVDELLPFDEEAIAATLLASTSLVTWPTLARLPAGAAVDPAPDPNLGGDLQIELIPGRPLDPRRAYAVRVARLPDGLHAPEGAWVQLSDCSLVARLASAR